MIRRVRFCFLILIGLSAIVLNAQRAIPDDNLGYPVLVSLGDGSSGSGFFLNTGSAVYLVTAKHVLYNEQTNLLRSPRIELLSYSRDPDDPTRNLFILDLSILEQSGNLKSHPTADVTVVRLFDVAASSAPAPSQTPPNPSTPSVNTVTNPTPSTIHAVPGVSVQSVARYGILGVEAATNIKTFDKVLVGNDVILFGYPNSLALRQFQQLDPSRPLLRKGIVAGKNPDRKSIILDCPVYFGNSGGPVLEIDHEGFGEKVPIIGVVDQFVPFVQAAGAQTFQMQFEGNSGYSIIVPMDFVLELTH